MDPASDNAETSPAEEENVHKVFVGNLSYKIKEEELENYFGQAGNVLNATIVHYNGRSAGFGFVTFETQEMAEEAVRLLDKTECLDRPINVERTTLRAERESTGRGRRGRGARGRAPRGRRGRVSQAPHEGEDSQNVPSQSAEGETEGEANDENKQQSKPRPKRKNNRRKPAATNDEDDTKQETKEQQNDSGAPASERKRAPRPRRVRKPRVVADGEEVAGDEEAKVAKPRERRPRKVRPRGPPSEKTLFVANLPFSLTDDGLSELFKDFKISSAHVVPRRGTKGNKGFGYVELATHDEQLRAVEELTANVISTDGRDLSVKVALEEIRDEPKEVEAAEPARIDVE